MKFANEEQSTMIRNSVVKAWDFDKSELREIREQGIGLTNEQWSEWDAIDAKYGQMVAEIDQAIYSAGWMY